MQVMAASTASATARAGALVLSGAGSVAEAIASANAAGSFAQVMQTENRENYVSVQACSCCLNFEDVVSVHILGVVACTN